MVVTGDLTDAKTADYSGSEQYIEEWQTYQHIVHSVTNNSDILWLDIRGNHDNFDVPSPLHRLVLKLNYELFFLVIITFLM